MSDEFDRISRGGAQVGVGLATTSPLRIVDGLATVFGLETNASIVQKAVAIEHEDFVFETLLQLKDGSSSHKARLDTFEQRMAMVTWMVEEHQRRLGELGAVPSDLAALLDASFKVWQATADAKKRKVHRNALRNAFDPKQYEEGLTLRLLGILETLTYGEVWTLHQLRDQLATLSRRGSAYVLTDEVRLAAKVPFRRMDLEEGSLQAEHIRRLRDAGLCLNRLTNYWPNERPPSSQTDFIVLTELGERLLVLTANPPREGPDKAPDAVPAQ